MFLGEVNIAVCIQMYIFTMIVPESTPIRIQWNVHEQMAHLNWLQRLAGWEIFVQYNPTLKEV